MVATCKVPTHSWEEVETVESSPTSLFEFAKDLFALTKPRLGSLVLFTMSAGILLAPGFQSYPLHQAILAVLATFGIIGASNSFNMYFDRRIDSVMDRTKTRPIPTGRLLPKTAVLFGIFLLAVSLPVLYWNSNLLTAGLGALAAFLYVCVYTPMKTKTPAAVYVGTIPGGLPMLMGFTAVTNQLDGLGLSLFAILVFWQLPHFLSIALNLENDYRKADVKVYSVAKGSLTTRRHLILYSFVLWAITLLPSYFVAESLVYFVVANLLGFSFFVGSIFCLRFAEKELDRKYFLGTLAHLPILLIVLILDIYVLHMPF